MIRTSDEFHEDAAGLLEAGLLQEALDTAREGIRRFPGNSDLRFIEAAALSSLGHYPLARGILEELERVEPDDVGVMLELAEVCANMGRRQDAMRYARAALSNEDCDASDSLHLAEIFDQHGDSAEVARCCAISVNRDASVAEAWFLMGCALAQMQRGGPAEFCCRRAITLCPTFWIAKTMLGLICYDARRFEEAKSIWGSIPLEEHHDGSSLVRWRSLLPASDPQVKQLRKRWREIRAEERPKPPHPLLERRP